MKNIKISIIGNSVALRNRPVLNHPDNINYCKHIEIELEKKDSRNYQVVNLSDGGITIVEVINDIDKFVSTFPDYFIINLGAVDAPNREIPHWLNKIINNKLDGFFRNGLKYIHAKFIKPNRSFFVKLRGKRGWVSEKRFTYLFRTLLEYLVKETNAKVIVLGINPTTDRVEKQLPGTKEKYKKFSNIMNTITNNLNQKYINLDDLNPEIHCPDGVHFSSEGHKEVSLRIVKIIQN
ncbi:MAG: hypothetical protein U9N34_05220 [Candidatus Cloacimonadota bacterium]|nr:hypothetical protein [Candidatus Cloacimonadota bacterium]